MNTLKSPNVILIITFAICLLYLLYNWNKNIIQLNEEKQKKQNYEKQIDSLNLSIILNQKEIITLQEKIKQYEIKVDSINQKVVKTKAKYNEKYKTIHNYSNVDIANELELIFSIYLDTSDIRFK